MKIIICDVIFKNITDFRFKVSFLYRSFINKQKIFLSKIKNSKSFKEIILIICLKIIKKSFIKKSSYFQVCLILDGLFLHFRNEKDELDYNFSELELTNIADFEKQKTLLERYNNYNSVKKDLLIQEKISHLNHLTSGPSQKWLASKSIESEITKKQAQIFRKQLLGPEWYMNIGHLSLLGYLAVWKSKDYVILEVTDQIIANNALYKIIKQKFKVIKCSHLEYSALVISCPHSFFKLGSIELSKNSFPIKHLISNAYKNKKETFYKTKRFSCLNKLLDEEIIQGHKIFPCFITLHVRGGRGIKKENARTLNGRNAFILNYKKTIEYLISEGYNVIRIGDYKSSSLPFINGFIDLTQKKYSKDIDIKLLSNAKFHIGTSSGPINIPPMFGKPVLLTNAVNPTTNFRYPNSLLIPKVWINKNNNKEITYNELLQSNLRLIEDHTELGKFRLRENTSEEILFATKDMIDILNDQNNSKEMFRNICRNYDEYLFKNNINSNTNDMPLAPSFLQKFINY